MPSPRTSPSVRPPSPMSPGYKASSHFDTLQLPPQRPTMHQRKSSNNQRPAVSRNALKLPSLPTFHPANYPSSNHYSSTPDGNSHASSPHTPISPRARQRMYSDAQKQLYFNQREMLNATLKASSPGKPDSPRLAPLGSPGPVTPLELERGEGYLIAGARSTCATNETPSQELVENLIRAEVQRQHGGNHARRRGE
ncbi:hypothetical protein AC579_8770 [Pseudocercospora musae]|uniref:Uncharacterized protein n=1 Tax=Pseudocercospora musae TaxID=113226 RepID=A0A139IW71_9PEZI|nr:hypothetical protein AC579_8770 [Pseudocercospora musae]